MNDNKKSYASMSGAELMTLYQRRDIEAFNCLYDKYKSRVYGYLDKRVNKRTEVDEIFQDVFLRLHHSRSRYKSEFPFEPWLFTVLRNSLIDYYRKSRKEHHDVPLDNLEIPPSALQVEDKHNLDGLLPKNADLTKNQRQAIELRYGEDFSFEEIAHRLETTSPQCASTGEQGSEKVKKIYQA